MAVLIRGRIPPWVPVAVALAAAFPLVRPARAQEGAARLESRVKAAYLINFTRYVQWPPPTFSSVDTPLQFCVVGRTPLLEELERQAAGHTSQGRAITVKRVFTRPEAVSCHVVFITFDEWRSQPDLAASLVRPGVLTVGESEAFAAEGGVIGFVPVQQSLRFAVNLKAGAAAGLGLSSRMLALATRVYGDSAEGPE